MRMPLLKSVEDRYINDIQRQLEIIGSTYPPLRSKKHQQFLFWFMWINFKWGPLPSERPPAEVLDYLCDNGNDQTIDAFYFDDSDKVVYLVQSKFIHDWRDTRRINYNELKRTADIAHYFDTPRRESIIYQKANQKCRGLLDRAYEKKIDGYSVRVILVSNKLDPEESNLRKLEDQTEIELKEWNFESFCRPKLIRLYAEFLEGHNPPIPPYLLNTITDKYLYVPEPNRDLEAYIAVAPVDEIIELYTKFGDRIFEKNVRSFRGDTRVNKEIKETLDKDCELFFYRNSGLTILANDVEPVPPRHGQKPGLRIKDIQIINGQQTTRILAKKKNIPANILITVIGPCKHEPSAETDLKEKKRIETSIIRARNLQNKLGFADLKSNDPVQVSLWRCFKERGYYYERKKDGWKNLDYYAKGIYRQASEKKWGRIKKEDLAAEILAIIDDPFLSYKGEDYIFRDRYDDVFSEKFLTSPDLLLVLHLLYERYVYFVGRDLDTYPQYHVLSMLHKKLGIRNSNARRYRDALEQNYYKSLVTATKILYKLSDMVVGKLERERREHIGYNKVFTKTPKVLSLMKQMFSSRSFSRQRNRFLTCIARFKDKL